MSAKKEPAKDIEEVVDEQVIMPHEDTGGTVTRKAYVEEDGFLFSPGSLVGSWFHALRDDRIVWQGVIVAEPGPGTYLLQVDKLDPGAEDVQILVSVDAMCDSEDGYEYRFYDTEVDAKSAYGKWIGSESERA
jgi:hypothetical protein